MALVVPTAFLLLAQATAQTSQPQSATTPIAAPAPDPADRCPAPSLDSKTIVVCSDRPQGYRLNPDVIEARREVKSGGRPTRPGGTPIADCAHVGPAPCMETGINLIGMALTAAEMAERLAKGREIASMFETDPHPDEYHLYLMAKARREAEEAQKAADAKAAAAKAKAAAAGGSPPPAKAEASQ